MSRTDNTRPIKIQEDDLKYNRSRRYPQHWGGCYEGIGRKYLRKWWRAERRKVNMAMHKMVEPEPSRHRHFCKWDYW